MTTYIYIIYYNLLFIKNLFRPGNVKFTDLETQTISFLSSALHPVDCLNELQAAQNKISRILQCLEFL
jgi:hypothetical protein